MLGWNIFDKVDKISNSHFFLLQDSKNKFFYMEQKFFLWKKTGGGTSSLT